MVVQVVTEVRGMATMVVAAVFPETAVVIIPVVHSRMEEPVAPDVMEAMVVSAVAVLFVMMLQAAAVVIPAVALVERMGMQAAAVHIIMARTRITKLTLRETAVMAR